MTVPRFVTGAIDAGAAIGSGVGSLGARAGRRTVAAAGDLAGRALLQAVREALAWSYTADALDLVVRSSVAEHAVDSALDGPLIDSAAAAAGRHAVVERIVAQALDSPDFQRIVMGAIESEGVERLMTQVLESRMLEDLVRQLLENDDLWRLIDGIALSPSVTAALSRTSRGLADEVAEGVRDRSRGADAWLERVARRVSVHRHDDPSAGRLIPGDP
jgi:hypothetical protein